MPVDKIQKGFEAWYTSPNPHWEPVELHPHAVSPNRFDDAACLLQGIRGGRLLDVGCGAGATLVALAEQFDSLTGFDYTKCRIDLASQAIPERYPQLAPKIRLLHASAEAQFPFEDGAFDVVLCMSVLDYVRDVFFTVGEMARVCRLGGVIVLTVPNLCTVRNALAILRGDLPGVWRSDSLYDMGTWQALGGWEGGKLHSFNKRSLQALLRWAGFEPEQWSGHGRLCKLLRWHLGLVPGLAVRARRVAQRKP
jgi:SAM-dependent methyltransferase